MRLAAVLIRHDNLLPRRPREMLELRHIRRAIAARAIGWQRHGVQRTAARGDNHALPQREYFDLPSSFWCEGIWHRWIRPAVHHFYHERVMETQRRARAGHRTGTNRIVVGDTCHTLHSPRRIVARITDIAWHMINIIQIGFFMGHDALFKQTPLLDR